MDAACRGEHEDGASRVEPMWVLACREERRGDEPSTGIHPHAGRIDTTVKHMHKHARLACEPTRTRTRTHTHTHTCNSRIYEWCHTLYKHTQ